MLPSISAGVFYCCAVKVFRGLVMLAYDASDDLIIGTLNVLVQYVGMNKLDDKAESCKSCTLVYVTVCLECYSCPLLF